VPKAKFRSKLTPLLRSPSAGEIKVKNDAASPRSLFAKGRQDSGSAKSKNSAFAN
jgi:hypothetical protein